jgi:hypothetical protein
MASVKRRVRVILFSAIALLYLISVPWYRATGDEVAIVFGLPDWVAVALACYVGVAFLNCAVWLLSEVPDGPPGGEAPPA